ncbi:MAG: hypothetical protein J6R54_07000, partial [Bacteroidaceae bacterium]|nr:hypothetical protein [Bacteroidaceae bacterium]
MAEGAYKLPESYSINAKHLPDSICVETEKFVQEIVKTSGCKARITSKKKADIEMYLDTNLPNE